MQKHFFLQNNAKMKCAAYHAALNLLVAGFSNGLFGLYELPDFNMIHTLRYFIKSGFAGDLLSLVASPKMT